MEEQLKKELLEAVRAERVSFTKISEHFYQQTHRPKESYIALCEAVINTVDRILEKGDVTKSAFLQSTFEPLINLRDEAKVLLAELRGESAEEALGDKRLGPNQEKCYISLYQNKGNDMDKWALQLASIGQYIASRPVYRKEDDVQKVLRLKLSQTQEGYAVVAVDKSVLESSNHVQRQDRYGNELVTLPVGSVTSESVLEFVHIGRRYRLNGRKLIPL